METQLLAVCKTKTKELLTLEQDYLKRFPHHFRLSIRELGGEKFSKHSPEEQKKLHSALVTDLKIPDSQLILLDENSKEYSTRGFAEFLTDKQERGINSLTFAIGGPCGWSDELKDGPLTSLSLSKLTLPYQIARLVLVEQLYRIFTIHSNLPYHR